MRPDRPWRDAERPARPFNPPHRDAIQYRVTSHGASFRRTLTHLVPHMAGLSAGHRDDPTIALLDAWAMVADVLTFYQERIANEGYLRTATERRSIVELARHVYELDHGVAATTHIAFTVDEDAGEIPIPAGTRILSVPIPGEGPQTFETSETITGRADWNEIPLEPSGTAPVRWSPALEPHARELHLRGTNLGLTPGSWILVKSAERDVFRLLQVLRVASDPALNRTTITWVRRGAEDEPPPRIENPEFLWLRQELRLLGYNLPLVGKDDLQERLERIKAAAEQAKEAAAGQAKAAAEDAWNHARSLHELTAGRFPNLQDAVAELLLAVHGAREEGANGNTWENAIDAVTQVTESLGPLTDLPHFRVHESASEKTIDLAREASDLLPDTWLALVDNGKNRLKPVLRKATGVTQSAQQQRFGLLSHTTRIELDESIAAAFDLRDTRVLAGAEPLAPWRDPRLPVPDDEPDEARQGTRTFTSPALPADAAQTLPGRTVAIQGRVDGRPAAEIGAVTEVKTEGEVTLEQPLRHRFDPVSVVCNANMAPASHGETVEEVLGGGNSTQVSQRFTLRRSPLSFTASARGPVPALAIHVNGAAWQRVESLDEVEGAVAGYMVRMRDDGTTSIVFGDGVNGARLPSGLDNVVATYRVGMGAMGNVAAGRLTSLPNPPPGVRSAVNPAAARGGRDPDTLEQARSRAEFATRVTHVPITRTEFQDRVRASGEVSKVTLRLLSTSSTRELVHFTVVSKDLFTTPPGLPTDELCASLERELSRAAPSPGRDYSVQPYTPSYFSIRISSVAFDGTAAGEVRRRAEAELDRRFALSQSEFGQVLRQSQVEEVLRHISGLQSFAVKLHDHGTLRDNPAGPEKDSIEARSAHISRDEVHSDQLLVLAGVEWP